MLTLNIVFDFLWISLNFLNFNSEFCKVLLETLWLRPEAVQNTQEIVPDLHLPRACIQRRHSAWQLSFLSLFASAQITALIHCGIMLSALLITWIPCDLIRSQFLPYFCYLCCLFTFCVWTQTRTSVTLEQINPGWSLCLHRERSALLAGFQQCVMSNACRSVQIKYTRLSGN